MMVQRYNPEYGYFDEYSESVDHAFMTQCKNGQWVRLSTYQDATAQLRAENARLKQQLKRYRLEHD
jgi:hypothetical protein